MIKVCEWLGSTWECRTSTGALDTQQGSLSPSSWTRPYVWPQHELCTYNIGFMKAYTPFGNSMRSLALLRLAGGKDFWKSVRAASRWCFGRHVLEHWYFYLHSCRFGISLMCQFHWELDCVGFSPFEIWRCGCGETCIPLRFSTKSFKTT